ncbi:amidohydrolase family protein, partial [Bifidobacterium sp. MSK23_139]|nr:amidohydrolase family protein [Bifidobacterium sp. MSK23_139]
IYDTIPQPTIEEIKDNILIAQKELHSYGITSVQSDDLLSATSDYHDALQAFEQLRAENKLTIRVYEQAQLPTLKALKEFINLGYCTGSGDEFFKIGPLKMLG